MRGEVGGQGWQPVAPLARHHPSHWWLGQVLQCLLEGSPQRDVLRVEVRLTGDEVKVKSGKKR